MTVHLTDDELANVLRECRLENNDKRLLVVADSFHCQLFKSGNGQWDEIGVADIGDKATFVVQPLLEGRRLHWIAVDKLDPRISPLAQGAIEVLTKTKFKVWCKSRDALTIPKGRQGNITEKTARKVERLAGWRCQFEGCGVDLSTHLAESQSANYAYLAHIVAASPDGPRGDALWSGPLADDNDNIMLLCDKCHRLVDRVDPDAYPREVLEEMRRRQVAEVKRLLDTLAYPAAQMLSIGGNIVGQNVQFDQKAAEEAMWHRKLRATTSPYTFSRNAGFLWKTTTPNYWETLFESLKHEIPALKGLLDGSSRGGAHPLPLAVFPLHNTSVQVLTGRILGESGTVQIFQFHRNEVAGRAGGQWRWPEGYTEPAEGKFKVKELRPFQDGDTEATLLVYLSWNIPQAELPLQLFDGVNFVLPTLEVTVDTPSHAAISHPVDLELAGKAFDAALQKIQDEWRVRRFHLVVIAPSSACMRLGQKLQARHQPSVVLYERQPVDDPNVRGPFVPTIEISSTHVRLPGTTTFLDLA